MMRVSARRSIACLLILCVLVVGGFASAQAFTHESHHAHHQKATHGTILCSWMCAAGQMLDTVQVVPHTRFDILVFDFAFDVNAPFGEPVESRTSRGPPVLPL
jgi:hypothetical protein